jgi:DNA-binding CsgD family transcriptional regulator
MMLETFSFEARPRLHLRLPELPADAFAELATPPARTGAAGDALAARVARIWDDLVEGRLSISGHRVDASRASLFLTPGEAREPCPERALKAEILAGALTGRAQKITALDHRLMPSTLSLWMSCTLRDMGLDCCVRQAPLGVAMLAFAHTRGLRALTGYQLAALHGLPTFRLDMPRPEPSLRDRLSPCEYEVVCQVIAGASYLQIGRARGVSSRTVANQLRSAAGKLGVIGRYQWLYLAMELSHGT